MSVKSKKVNSPETLNEIINEARLDYAMGGGQNL